MSEINIRPATPDDLGIVIDFSVRLAAESEGLDLDREVLAAGIGSALEDSSKAQYFLAETAGEGAAAEVAGQLMITYEWSDWRNGYFWWIQSVYVDPDHRRRGVYRALNSQVHAEAKERGDVCGLRLYVERNNHVAQQVYSSLDMHQSHYDLFEIDFVL